MWVLVLVVPCVTHNDSYTKCESVGPAFEKILSTCFAGGSRADDADITLVKGVGRPIDDCTARWLIFATLVYIIVFQYP